MEDSSQDEAERQRAEVFDALGHPTRIAILKALAEGSQGFAELKKKTAIGSSGHLQHHLNKLDGLIKTDEYGKYCLSDEGKDAILTVETVENASTVKDNRNHETPSFRFNTRKTLKAISLLLVGLLIATSSVAIYEYSQTLILQYQVNRTNALNLEAAAYYDQFGAIPSTSDNSSFTPPTSMYRALQIGLERDGWNKTSLRGMLVSADLIEGTISSSYDSISTLNGPITTPPASYSRFNVNNTTYAYFWAISIENASRLTTPPLDLILIDASIGQVFPTPPLF